MSLKSHVSQTKEMNEERQMWYQSKKTLTLAPEKSISAPYLITLSSDSFLNGRAWHTINLGKTTVGRKDALTVINFPLGGAGVTSNHCEISNSKNMLFLKSECDVFVNGVSETDTDLHHGDIICIGSAHMFYVWNKTEINLKKNSKDSILMKQIEKQIFLPSLSMEIEPYVETAITDLKRSSRRHWQKFDSVKNQLFVEAERCLAILKSVQEGRTKRENVDVSSVSSTHSECESSILDMEEWRMKHDKVVKQNSIQLYHAIQEANEISDELEKFMEFEVALVAVGGPKNEPEKILIEDDEGGDEEKKDSGSFFGVAAAASASSGLLDFEALNVPSFER